MIPVRQSIGGLGNLMFKQAYLISQVHEGNIPDVYVQGERYFRNHADSVKSIFSEGIKQNDYVSLHIRRGDYLKAHHYHTDLSQTDYYQKAVTFFPEDTFLVFCKDNQGEDIDTEDRYWCDKFLERLIPGRYEFVPFSNSETEDLNLMASCKHNIMANSTFSWWAAYLNPNKNKKVICPKKWFVDDVERCELLEEWIKI